MLSLYILEDDFQQQSRLESAIKSYGHETGAPYRLEVHGKSEQLLEAISVKGSNQVFFLDIEIKEEAKKGLEVAKAIREMDQSAVIVFVTTHSEYMPLTFQYQVSALDFIDKNVNEELYNQKIFDTLNYAKTNFSIKKEGLFIFENRFSCIRLSYDEIYFVETSETVHKLILHGKYDYMEFYGTIAEIAEKTDLIRCHRSFAINPQNVTRVDKAKGLVYFPNGEKCSVSKKNLKKITQLMSNQEGGVK